MKSRELHQWSWVNSLARVRHYPGLISQQAQGELWDFRGLVEESVSSTGGWNAAKGRKGQMRCSFKSLNTFDTCHPKCGSCKLCLSGSIWAEMNKEQMREYAGKRAALKTLDTECRAWESDAWCYISTWPARKHRRDRGDAISCSKGQWHRSLDYAGYFTSSVRQMQNTHYQLIFNSFDVQTVWL